MSDFAVARRRMVDCQVRPSDVTDLRIIDAMLEVPREYFVPKSLQSLSYLDQDLNVSESGLPPRVLLKPALLARMLQAAAVTENDNVLVVGCASGYAAAVIGKLASNVVATEAVPELVVWGNEALSQAGATNVTLKQALSEAGDPANAPFDVILLQGASQVSLAALQQQLRLAGRLVWVDATATGLADRAVLLTRSEADFGSRVLFNATAPVLPGLERRAAFVF